MQDSRNHYRTLYVCPDAPPHVIRDSYRALMQKLRLHPDYAAGYRHAALLNAAYAALCDPVRRADHDRALLARYDAASLPGALLPFAVPDPDDYRPLVNRYCAFCKTPHAAARPPDDSCAVCASPLFRPPHDLPGISRRNASRSSRDERVVFYDRWPGPPNSGRLDDLSPNGMRLATEQELVPGLVVKVDAADFQATGEVVHRHRTGAIITAGVRFLTVRFHRGTGNFVSTCA